MYYLGSRYYDPQVKRFINADSYASTGQKFLGQNMFAYCCNNPVRFKDPAANSAVLAAEEWLNYMWWITMADGPVPVGDSIYVTVAVILALLDIATASGPEPPDVEYPGDDPAQAPDGYSWTGPDAQGGTRGGYKNDDPNKKDSWHPDLDNETHGPHWDYNDVYGHKWRVYPEGGIELARNNVSLKVPRKTTLLSYSRMSKKSKKVTVTSKISKKLRYNRNARRY